MHLIDDQTNDDIDTPKEYEQSEDDDDGDAETVQKEKLVLTNLERMRQRVIEKGETRDIFQEKTRLAIETKDLTWSKRLMTLIGDYSQNLALPHAGNE